MILSIIFRLPLPSALLYILCTLWPVHRSRFLRVGSNDPVSTGEWVVHKMGSLILYLLKNCQEGIDIFSAVMEHIKHDIVIQVFICVGNHVSKTGHLNQSLHQFLRYYS